MEEATHYRNLNSRAYILHNKAPYIRNQEQLDSFNKLLSDPYMTIDKATNETSKVIYHSIMGGYYHNIMDYENLYKHAKNQINVIKSSETIMKVKHGALMVAYANLINACINTGRKFEALKYLKEKNQTKAVKMLEEVASAQQNKTVFEFKGSGDTDACRKQFGKSITVSYTHLTLPTKA